MKKVQYGIQSIKYPQEAKKSRIVVKQHRKMPLINQNFFTMPSEHSYRSREALYS